jgi:hypothetical protein
MNNEHLFAAGPAMEMYREMKEGLRPVMTGLASHPIYRSLHHVDNLRIFMENHVFAVWDFMTLLKVLQRALTCVDKPWVPRSDILAARLINEIVLGEETDEVAPHQYTSHFNLYLAAMNEAGADCRHIQRLVSGIRQGVPLDEAMDRLDIPGCTKAFVKTTFYLSELPTHEVAGAFIIGREVLLPPLFSEVLKNIPLSGSWRAFRLYLERHVDLDSNHHGPLGEKLLCGLCELNRNKWKEVGRAAHSALEARRALWDGICHQFKGCL